LYIDVRVFSAVDGSAFPIINLLASPGLPMTETQRDEIFAQKTQALADFDFGERTAKVFDDMLDRSIPLYGELQRQISELAGEFAQPGTHIYDLGCSTGITMESMRRTVPDHTRIIGVDYSGAMLEKARQRFEGQSRGAPVEFVEADLNKPVDIRNASVVVLNLTLQFVRPLYRDSLVKAVYEGLNDKGCLILVEKVLGNHSLINRTFIKLYYDMKKRNGYSETEIAQKREALENVLIPYRLDENMELLNRCGFAYSDVFYKWYNFSGMLAVKNP
jgi:tRNA (cmo5U34)-methyltransferase